MSVRNISEAAGVPVSTAYKKIEKLREASLVTDATEVRPGGHHRSRYLVAFDRIVVGVDEHREFAIEIERELAAPERQFLGIWTEIRKEA